MNLLHLNQIAGLDMEDFDYNNYRHGELNILKPQLEELGYTNIRFRDGERDTFGPLSRIIDTDQGRLWYG